jgi:hypothetical protein
MAALDYSKVQRFELLPHDVYCCFMTASTAEIGEQAWSVGQGCVQTSTMRAIVLTWSQEAHRGSSNEDKT